MADANDDCREIEGTKASDLRSRTILESITDGFFSLDKDWRFDYVNPEAERIIGCLPGALAGKVLWEAFPGVVGTVFELTYRRVARERRPESFTSWYPDHGAWYDVRAFPSATGVSVFFHDVTAAKETEAALRASEDRRRLALDSAELGAWNIDPAQHVLTTDERFCTIFAGSPAPLGYAQAVAALHADDRAAVSAAIAAAIRPVDPAPYAIEYRVVHPTGAVRWVFAKGRANFTGDGVDRRLVSLDGTVADITDRKLADQRLQISESRFRTLFDSIDEGFCVIEMMFDADGTAQDYRFLEANPAFVRHTGLHDAVGKTMRDLAPDMDPVFFETYGRVVTGGEPIRFISESKALQRWFDVYAFRLGEAAERKVAVLFTDVTARRLAEDRLRDAEEQFRNLADNIAQFAWTADASGSIYWYNRRWYDYTGTTLEAMQGWGWQAVHHPDHVARVVERFSRFLASGEPWEDTFPLRAKDGSYRWFLSRAQPIRNAEGELLRWFGTNTDITEQRDTAEQLRGVAAELSEADRRKDEFLATLAHELRNPLAPISSSLEIFRLAKDNEAMRERARLVMERQVRQLTRLVDDLLDVSRISSDKLELRLQRTSLSAVVNSAVEASRSVLDGSGLRWSAALPAEPIDLNADLTRLAQVFMNLLNNAAKFTDRGGSVALTAEREQGEVVVIVKDTGIGIPADQLTRIFDMFSQVSSSLERSQGGLGIGLSLVRRLVELHGGRVEARSDGPGRGSELIVRLPVMPAAVEPATAVVEAAMTGAHRLRILVVDDNHDAAVSLSALLDLMGHETRVVHDGLAAVDTAAAWRPDVVLLDIGLPGLNGYEAARRIREHADGGRIVLCALTGWGQDSDRLKSRDAGFDHHLVKPADPAALERLFAGVTVSP